MFEVYVTLLKTTFGILYPISMFNVDISGVAVGVGVGVPVGGTGVAVGVGVLVGVGNVLHNTIKVITPFVSVVKANSSLFVSVILTYFPGVVIINGLLRSLIVYKVSPTEKVGVDPHNVTPLTNGC